MGDGCHRIGLSVVVTKCLINLRRLPAAPVHGAISLQANLAGSRSGWMSHARCSSNVMTTHPSSRLDHSQYSGMGDCSINAVVSLDV